MKKRKLHLCGLQPRVALTRAEMLRRVREILACGDLDHLEHLSDAQFGALLEDVLKVLSRPMRLD